VTELDYFVVRANLELFMEQLRDERDPIRRGMLVDLIIKEADKIGNLSKLADILRNKIKTNGAQVIQNNFAANHLSEGSELDLTKIVTDILADTAYLLAKIEEESFHKLAVRR
jgi:uncharacterized protein YwbE